MPIDFDTPNPDIEPTPQDPAADIKSYNCNKTKLNSKVKTNQTNIKYADPLSYNDLLDLEAQYNQLLEEAKFRGWAHMDVQPAGEGSVGPVLTFCERYKLYKESVKTLQEDLANPGDGPYITDSDPPNPDLSPNE